MMKYKLLILIFLFLPNIALAQFDMQRRTIIDKEALASSSEIADNTSRKGVMYGLGTAFLVVVAVMAARTALQKPIPKLRKRDSKL